jgi:cell division protein FtsA
MGGEVGMEQKSVNRIFALDIGTRTVVGVLAWGSAGQDRLEITDMEVMEHRDRSMFDGQIHDIDQVAQVVMQVKKRLEDRNNCTLEHVSVAAAGRALITHRTRVNENVEGWEPADTAFVNSMELKAMQKSQKEIQSSYRDKSQYYCVGYSVVDYYLDGTPITSLKGHRGYEMGVEVISTFLPRTVVDSLYTVMERAGLEVINLTLEPIAAIQLAIPASLRMLNLAMVDIGAGTSDIAIARGGSISAYSMVSIAGDEVTEKIAQHFLTDFKTAERVKIQLLSGGYTANCRDIMGSQVEISGKELLEIIRPVVERMADEIAKSIIKYNQGPPKALFCIGGGSQTPGLKESLSSRLGIPVNRVGIKGLEESDQLKISAPGFLGPEYITPAGIALAGYRATGDHFIEVTVNGKGLRLLNTKEITIRDALLSIGFAPRKLIPARGEGVKFVVNGETREIKGKPGTAAVIKLNGQETDLDAVLENGSIVEIQEATSGSTARPTVAEIIHRESCQVTLEDKRIALPVQWTLNGSKAATDEVINEGDSLEIIRIRNLGEFVDTCGLPREGYIYRVNGKNADFSHILNDGDSVKLAENNRDRAVTIVVNGEELKLPFRKEPYIFVDLFNYMDFDTSETKGKIDLAINGKKAGYTDIIKEGDSIDISWNRV